MLNWLKLSQQNQGIGASPNFNGSIPVGMPQFPQSTQNTNQISTQQNSQIL